jgi:hypothetical protein
MHADAYAFVADAARRYRAAAPVLEIGARNINGSIREVLPAEGYVGIDLRPGPGVDLVTDARVFVPGPVFATVVCCEVLEHTAAADEIVAAGGEALEPGGLLIVTCAGAGRAPHSAVDGGPLGAGEYYRNLSLAEVTAWAAEAGIEVLPAPGRPVPGDVYYVGRKRARPAA